jgi:hypothetical protein
VVFSLYFQSKIGLQLPCLKQFTGLVYINLLKGLLN